MLPLPPRRNAAKIDKRYSSVAWRKARTTVRRRDRDTCQECGRRPPAVRLVVDHRTPPHRYAGSFTDLDNLWTLCHGCNVSKGDLTVDEWHTVLERRGARPSTPIIRPEPTSGRPPSSDPAFLGWAMGLHGVSAAPDHVHGKWEARIEVHTRAGRFAVCPQSCVSPVRWPLRSVA